MKKDCGFTLIEILLAMGVFLIGVVSILAVFPRATQQTVQSNDDNIAASFAESIRETLSKGLKSYVGDPDVLVNEKITDLVWFSLPLDDGSQQDFFMLPRGLGTGDRYSGSAHSNEPDGVDDKDQCMTWYPIAIDPAESWSGEYQKLGFGSHTASNEFIGFLTNGGRVRRMGRAALGASDLITELESTEADFEERLKDFYWCFSVKHDGRTPNLYHFTLYIFGNGVVEPGVIEGLKQTSVLLDSTKPQSKMNQFLHKFDFLIGTT